MSTEQPPAPEEQLSVEELGHCEALGRHHVPTDFYETDRHVDHDGESVWLCVHCEEAIQR